MLTDHHCHLQDPKILPEIEKLLLQARNKDIFRFICCGTGEEDWSQVLKLSERYSEILPAVGVHPWFVEKSSPDWIVKLERLLKQVPKCMIGEIGLDLYFCRETLELQKFFFEKQMLLGRKYGRPVSIHNVRASHLLLPFLRQFSDVKVLLHSFSASPEMTRELAALPKIFFSFSGTLLNSSKKLKEQIHLIPFNRILLETDSPDLLPQVLKNSGHKINVPANLIFVLEKMAEILNIAPNILKEQLAENSDTFLKDP
ncbi:MAG: TatD family hydrolase [Candidatus Marinimicrobia bacterium]|nr:TatD family hydrolase [Candidatus Neomarinimicrobiota bacterium]